MSRFKAIHFYKKFPTLNIESRSINQLIQLFLTEKTNIRAFILYSLAANIFLLFIPFTVKTLIEQISLLYFQKSTISLLLIITLFLTGIAFMKAIQYHLNERFQRRLFCDLSKDLTQAFDAKCLTDDKKHLANYFFEIITLQKTSSYLIFDGLTLFLQTAIGLLLISLYHPLFVIYSLLLLLGFYYIFRILGREVFTRSITESNKKYKVISLMQSLAIDKNSENETSAYLLDYMTAREERYKAHFKQVVGLLLLQAVGSVMLLILGLTFVLQNKMTLGQLVASELIISNVLLSLFKFSHLLDYWYDSLVSMHKIDEVLKEVL